MESSERWHETIFYISDLYTSVDTVDYVESPCREVCPPSPRIPSWMSPNSTFLKKHFRRFCQGFTEIPSGIPSDTQQVKIYCNPLTVLHADVFVNLSQCHYMYLGLYCIRTLNISCFYYTPCTHTVSHTNVCQVS